MTILYVVKDKLYVNITNLCPCNCTFCIRNNGEGAYGSDSLWLENEPTEQQILDEFAKYNLGSYKEIVFCGYGEPTERIETVISVARFLKSVASVPIRINTNGLSDLINGRPTAHLLEGIIDTVSISLNAGSAEQYQLISQPSFGIKSFDALLKFAADCKNAVPKVIFTVVDVISKDEISRAKTLAASMGIELRIRSYDA